MTRRRLVLASRNPDKLREIREILADYPEFDIIGLDDAGIPESPEEDALEEFETFEENALAKARYFAARTRELTLADDSGICVDALDGRPGVHSRRFAQGPELRGLAQDRANNELLLRLLADKGEGERGGQYVSAAAVVQPDGREMVFRGTTPGGVLPEARGTGGFGYDPLFYLPQEGLTFGELDPVRKNLISHRGEAVRKAADALRRGVDGPQGAA
ncbi:MAG TPA: non-canonical purine NTP pyrophosphatase [Longimicrobiaceae bacterium]|nr:non-canonical purine NTP pyrophosphatase [Longimicrobiaceae bacterium]